MGSNDTHSKQRSRTAAAVLIAALAVTACSADDDDAGGAAAAESTAESTSDMGLGEADEPAAVVAEGATAAEDSGGAATGQPTDSFDLGVVGRDVIIEMRVVLGSDDIERTVASVTAAASTLGGGIASSDVNFAPAGEGGFAVLVVKVPPDGVDRFLGGLDDTATVRSINQSARDVTEQLVDLDVRITNARQSVATVREFMDRTQNLNELVTLEAELTRRQTELERLEAQQRNLADRVALSTITLEILPNEALPEPIVEDDEGIGDALRSGWDAFVAVVFGLAFVVAATLPFLLALIAVGTVAWMVVRRRDRRSPPAARYEPPAPPADEHDEEDREPELVG